MDCQSKKARARTVALSRSFGIVYHIFNTIDGKVYIGQTWKSMEQRWREHQQKLSGCRYLSHAIHKYGAGCFDRTVLFVSSQQAEVDAAELYFSLFFNTLAPNGYNLRECGGVRSKFSDETRERMARSQLGKVASEKTRKACSDAQILRFSNPDQIQASVNSHMSQCRAVVDQNGIEYRSERFAAQTLGLRQCNIHRSANSNGRLKVGGYGFRYVL